MVMATVMATVTETTTGRLKPIVRLKKRILFNIHYLEIGGAETSLIGLLHSLNPDDFNVDLLINDPRGELMNYVPQWVNIIPSPEEYRMIERPIVEVLKRKHLRIVFARLIAKYKFGRYIRREKPSDGNAIFGYVGKYVTSALPSLRYLGEYDVAVSYVTPHNIVRDKVLAKKKIAWIHTDYSKVDVNPAIELPVWETFDKIVSISPDVTATFLSVFPSLGNKIIEIENFLPVDLILKRADEFTPEEMPKEKGIINLLTIGRYSQQKRMDEIPLMARIIKESGVDFRWYLIGYGNSQELSKIKEAIKKYNVADCVILLGKKENPYPYIKASDIYVQPSRYEGKSITVREAQLLGKPVVITRYPTAPSQIRDQVDGFIGPYDSNLFAEYLVKIITDSESLNKVIKNLNETTYPRKDNHLFLTF